MAMHVDEHEIDEALVRGLLTHQQPGLAGLPLRRVASSGTDNAVFRLGDDLAVRLPRYPGASDGVAKELRWLPVITPHLRVPVPEVVAAGEPSEAFPYVWAVVRWLDGTDANGVDVADDERLAVDLAAVITDLRAITPVPPPGSPGFVRGGPVQQRAAYVDEWLPRCAGLVDVDRVRGLWTELAAEPPYEGPPVWLHADLLPGNLLLRDGRLAAVIDFGTTCTGDPAYDVTPGWHLLRRRARQAFRESLRVDDATWRRAAALVLSGGVGGLGYYRETNPVLAGISRRGIEEVLAELG